MVSSKLFSRAIELPSHKASLNRKDLRKQGTCMPLMLVNNGYSSSIRSDNAVNENFELNASTCKQSPTKYTPDM